ncbi:hypothetical protein NDI49_30595 [Trichocoleus sp. ST-U3]
MTTLLPEENAIAQYPEVRSHFLLLKSDVSLIQSNDNKRSHPQVVYSALIFT